MAGSLSVAFAGRFGLCSMIKYFFHCLIIFFISGYSFAAVYNGQTCPAGHKAEFRNSMVQGPIFTSAAAACAATSQYQPGNGWSGEWTGGVCYLDRNNAGGGYGPISLTIECVVDTPPVVDPPTNNCPVIPDAGNVTVTMGYKSQNSDSAPKVINFYPNESDTPVTRTYCGPQNCRIKPKEPVFSCQRNPTPSSNGYYEVACTFASDQVGGVCTGGETPKNPPPPTTPPVPPVPPGQMPCPAGSVPTGLDKNGIMVCTGTTTPPVPPKISTDKPPVVTQNSDGSTTTTNTKTTTNADGSTTTHTTTTTVGADGGKTTTTGSVTSAVPDGAGGAGGGSTPGKEDAPPSDFCVQNPQLSICKNSTVAGTCGEVSCTGDAIQCATLRAAAAMECRQAEDIKGMKESPVSSLGEQIMAGADPMKSQITDALKGDVVDMAGKANLDESSFLPSSCFGAKSFTVMGHTVVADFGAGCSAIEPLKYVLLALAYIAAYLIVGRAITGG